MIPIPAWLTLRLVGSVALVATVAFAGWRVNTWHTSHGLLRATQSRLELEESCGEGSKCRARETQLREEIEREKVEVVEGLAAELAAVSNRPARVVRVCPDPGHLPVPGTPRRKQCNRYRLRGAFRTGWTRSWTRPLRPRPRSRRDSCALSGVAGVESGAVSRALTASSCCRSHTICCARVVKSGGFVITFG